MPDVRVVETLADVAPDAWAALFPGEPEDYRYLLAVERSGIAGFAWRYLLIEDDGRIVAAAPAFLTRYPLDTTLPSGLRRQVEALRRWVPEALILRLACIGSPCTERAQLGFAPDQSDIARGQLTGLLLDGFEAMARRERCGLLGLKDVSAEDAAPWATAAGLRGYQPIPSLPIAHLDIDFASLGDYLGRLSPGARKDMRRKLRTREGLRIEIRSQVEDVIDEIMALYRATLSRADMRFEELTAGFFLSVGRQGEGRAFYVLYFQGEALLAANLLIADDGVLVDKFFCMDAVQGRPLNLYFLSWFTNVELCLTRGLRRYQSGQAGYGVKLRLGSRLERTTNHFRHRNRLLNAVLGLAAPLFAADPTLDAAS